VQALGLYDHLTRIGRAVKRRLIPAPAAPEGIAGSEGIAAPEGIAAHDGQPKPADSGNTADTSDLRGLDELRADALYDLLSRDPYDAAETAAAQGTGADLHGRVQLVLTAEGVDALLATHGGTITRDTPTGGVKCELQG
ncbi:hypothetical protein, partial [Leucobacter sp. G161]|uniref:hypothetical protein n=1 Tax=Leucobacter sp. G161 TaxID=663704 RepID=UPI000A86762F